MKDFSINQAINGFTVTMYYNDAHTDSISESFVFHNAADTLEFLKQNIIDVKEAE